MGDRQSVVLPWVLAALVIGAPHIAGQILETVDVNIINQNFDPARIRVIDEVCEVVAFDGELLPNASTTVSLCPDRDQRGHMTIYDATGRAVRHENLLPSNVYLPMR